MQHYYLAKVAQIVNVVAFVILYDELINHPCQHGFVNAHKETLQIQFHDVTVCGVIVAGFFNICLQHLYTIQLTFAFTAVKSPRTEHQLKKWL